MRGRLPHEIDNEVNELQVLKAAWQSQQSALQYRIANRYPAEIAKLEKTIEKLTADLTTYKDNKPAEFSMVVGGEVFDERVKAGEKLLALMKKLGREIGDSLNVGYYAGFNVSLRRGLSQSISLLLCGQITYEADIGESALGNITRIENTAERIDGLLKQRQQEREETQKHYADAQKEAGVPFEHEARLAELLERKAVIDTELEFKDVKDEPDELIDDTVENPDGEGETIKVEAPSKTTEPPFALRGKRGPKRMRRIANDRQAENYDKMRDICGEILVHAAYYMRYEAEGYDNLEIYAMDEDIVSIGHPREVNGKVLYDPEIQFQIVDECRVVPLSFRNDNIGVCRETDTYSQADKDDLDKFLSEWLDRIVEQPYELAEKRDTVEMVDLDEMMAVVGGHEDTEEASI